MIVSRRWLEALLGRPLEGQDVADRLARQVAPVDGVVPIHQDLRDVLVANHMSVKAILPSSSSFCQRARLSSSHRRACTNP